MNQPDPARLTQVSRRHSALFRRVAVSQSITSSALELPKVSDLLRERVLQDHHAGETGLRSLLSEMVPAGGVDPVKNFEQIAATLAEQTAVNGEKVIAAAVIVLSHSTADDIFIEACKLAIELDSTSWLSELSAERKVSLGLLKEIGEHEVFARELERFKEQLSAKSLPNRAEMFFRHVPIRHHKMYRAGDAEYFQQPKLVEADEMRNSIVHGNGILRIDLEMSGRAMRFLHEAAITALRSLAYAHSIPLDGEAFFGIEKS